MRTAPMAPRERIALIAHDHLKPDILAGGPLGGDQPVGAAVAEPCQRRLPDLDGLV